MSQRIERYGGTIEKYAGDAILALFGVPVAHEDDPERAVLCALGMQQAIGAVADEVRRRYQREVAMRVGINTGEVVSGSWDASGQQQAAVSGDAVNVAARIQAVAEPGRVLVGAETMRLTRRRVQYGSEQLLALKGKREPVSAYPVLGIREQVGERWETTGAVIPLIGREGEMAQLLASWERVRGGEGQLVTVVGEPGVGKSRLVAEAIKQIGRDGGVGVLRGRCLSYGQSISLWLISDLLRSLCSVREDSGLEELRDRMVATVEELLAACDAEDRAIAADVLGEVLGLPPAESLVTRAGPQIRRQSLIRILGLLLGALTEQQPLVLVLEDLHWLDTASQQILGELLPYVPGMRVLVLVAQRPDGYPAAGLGAAPWAPWGWTEQIALRPLPHDQAAVLAGAVLGGSRLSSELEEHIRERAGGNPFFLEELLRFLEESGGLEQRDGWVGLAPGTAEKLPTTLTEVLLARLDRLDGQVKGVAQVGSVIGRSFAVRLLARVMERKEETLDGPLRSLQEAEIAFPRRSLDREYVFKHVTLRDVAYGMLVRKRQRQLHLAVARAITQLYPSDEYVEMIAYHYSRTEEDVEAAVWLERAGDRALATYANEAATGHYQEAIRRLERYRAGDIPSPVGDHTRHPVDVVPERAGIEAKLGRVLNLSARYEQAQKMLERAIERYREKGDLGAASLATANLVESLVNRGELEEARRRLEEMAERLEEHSANGHPGGSSAGSVTPGPKAGSAPGARLQNRLAGVFRMLGRYGEMLRAAERAGEMARAAGAESAQAIAEERRGTALILLGRLEEGREALERAIPPLEEAGDLLALLPTVGNLGDNRRLAGDLAEGLQLNERALELAIRAGEIRHEQFYHLNLAQILLTQGEWNRAREHIARAEEIGQARAASAYVAAWVPLHRGTLALREGAWKEATEQLGHAVELAAGAGREAVEEAHAALAELELLMGKPEQARDRLRGLVNEEGTNLPLLLPVLAWAQLELGAVEQGLALAREAERQARERQTLLYLPEALRIEGMVLTRLARHPEGHPEGTREGSRVLSEGRERAVAMPNPYTEARILVELGLLNRQEGKGERAEEQLTESLAIFQRLGARKDIERTEQELAELDRSADLTR